MILKSVSGTSRDEKNRFLKSQCCNICRLKDYIAAGITFIPAMTMAVSTWGKNSLDMKHAREKHEWETEKHEWKTEKHE
jgi:hypothetical protein